MHCHARRSASLTLNYSVHVPLCHTSSRGGGGEQDDNDDDATKAMTSSTATSSHTGHRRRNNKPLKKMHLLFLALYLHQIYWLISTSGTPYKLFLDKAEREGFEGE
jgi:hypothetical protein